MVIIPYALIIVCGYIYCFVVNYFVIRLVLLSVSLLGSCTKDDLGHVALLGRGTTWRIMLAIGWGF